VVGNWPINATVSATPVSPPSTPPGLTGSGGPSIAAADLNGDGRYELLVALAGPGGRPAPVSVYALGSGAAVWTPVKSFANAPISARRGMDLRPPTDRGPRPLTGPHAPVAAPAGPIGASGVEMTCGPSIEAPSAAPGPPQPARVESIGPIGGRADGSGRGANDRRPRSLGRPSRLALPGLAMRW
jgi:hypothetical protein